jgi:dual specificity MAP kinase phosphatase
VYATISDIVVYSTRADGSGARSALAIAQLLKRAIESKAAERERRGCVCSGVAYNVFVLAANADEVQQHLSHLLQRVSPDAVADKDGMPAVRGLDGVSETRLSAHAGGLGLAVEPKEEAKEPASASTRPHAPTLLRANTISFAMREKEEMRELTRASEILSIFSPSTPGGADAAAAECSATTTATHWDPTVGQLFLGNAGDVPCEDTTPVPEAARSPACIARPGARPAPPKAQRSSSIGDGFDHGVNDPAEGRGFDICVECHDMAPFPSSAHLRAAEQHIRLLDAHWADKIRRGGVSETELAQHPRPPPPPAAVVHLPFPSSPPNTSVSVGAILTFLGFLERMLAPVAEPPATNLISAPAGSRTASPVPPRSRPLKILLHSADGYTESSVLALCTLMALRGLALPEAYLALQVEKRRSFFVYQADLHLLRKVEARVRGAGATAPGTRRGSVGWEHQPSAYYSPTRMLMEPSSLGRAAGGRLDAMGPASAGAVPNPSALMPTTLPGRRPRASTSPLPSVFGDHQAWFSDPRFDGSFPSRVLPFLYLGNL